MSLLEDVFLEDEAGEAQELERIIEADDYDERPRTPNSNENSEKEDEAEEDKRHVDPTSAKPKRIVKNPRVILNPARLTGPRGIQIIPEHFKDFTFKGKGHEKDDLDLVLKKLEHWAYRLFPKFEFKDCLKKIETLGNKRPVMVHLTKIRNDQFIAESEETVIQQDSSDEEAPDQEPPEDEFDKLLRQQIELARATPGPSSAKKAVSTPIVEKTLTMPKATSSPSINNEQRERMLRNRQLAEERRLARLKLNSSENRANNTTHIAENINKNDKSTNSTQKNLKANNVYKDDTNADVLEGNASNTEKMGKGHINEEQIQETEDRITKAKHNRSNIIDSSDSDDDGLVINEAITVDVHNINYGSDGNSDTSRENGTNTDIFNENDEEMNTNTDQQIDDNQDCNSYHQNRNEHRSTEFEHLTEKDEDSNSVNYSNVNDTNSENDQINDVEMNIDNLNKSSDNNKQPTLDLDDTNSKDKDSDIEETNKDKIESNNKESCDNSTVVTKQLESYHHLKDVIDQSTENTEQNKETAIEYVMDIDFTDDF